ncbi:MAG: O-antigen ligase family protein [Desulfococcaceae bacterium]
MHFRIAIKYLLFFLLIATPLARGAVEGWAVALVHLVTWAAVVLFLLECSWKWDWRRIQTPLDLPLLVLPGLVLVSAVFSAHRYASFWSWLLLADCVVIYFLTIHTFRTRSEVRQLIYLIGAVALLLSIFGFFKLIGANPFLWYEYGNSQSSLSATYVNRNHMAGYLEMAIPLVLGLLMIGTGKPQKILIGVTAALLLLAIIFTLSRGGWIGLMVGLTFMSATLFAKQIAKNRKLLFVCSIVVLFGFITIISSTAVVKRVKTLEEAGDNPSLASRMLAWRGIIEMIRDYPVLGAGPGTFSDIYTQYQPPGYKIRFMMGHNDYLHFTSEVGLGLVVLILWMGFVFYRNGLRKLKSPSRLVRGSTLGAMTGITAILVHSISDFNLHVPANAILFTVLAAIAMAPPPARRRTKGEVGMPERIYEFSAQVQVPSAQVQSSSAQGEF